MILEMRNICKDYPMGKTVTRVLRDVSLNVSEGEYLAIMGPSGSGKTTLMNIIGCLDEPTSGSYLLCGQDITACTDLQLAQVRNQELGFVFQSFHLLPRLTALDNVALPLLYGGVKKGERRERARCGAGDGGPRRPDRPSPGPAVRRASASVWPLHGPWWAAPSCCWRTNPPALWILPAAHRVMELFRQLHENGATIIMITHDAQVARQAQRIMTIRDGVLSGGDSHE